MEAKMAMYLNGWYEKNISCVVDNKYRRQKKIGKEKWIWWFEFWPIIILQKEKKNLAGAEADNMEMSPGQISDINLPVTLPLLN